MLLICCPRRVIPLSVLCYRFRPVRLRSAQAGYLKDFACRYGDRLLLLFGKLARYGTPVPQPLSVMNSVKAKGRKRLVAGEGMSEVKSKRCFCAVVSDTHGF